MLSRTVNAPTRATAARLDWVDAAKGISILLVVAHHVVWYMQHAGLAPAPVVMANEALASLRMPLFFLASGLFAAGPLSAPWRVVLHKRVAFFLYLYVIWTIIRFTFFATLVPPEVDPDGSADPVAFALALLLPGPSMWFLYALAVFAVLTKLARPLPVWVQLGASGALSALVGAGLVDFGDTRWTYMARFLFFFVLGCHARELVERIAATTSLLRAVLGGVVCVVAAGAVVALGLRGVPGVVLALQCLAVGAGLLVAAWFARYRFGRPLVVLGTLTLPVYLIHMMWLAVIMTGLRHIELSVPATYALPFVLVPLLTVLSLLTQRALTAAGASWLFALPPRLAYRGA
jgi:fucose 4-O-acetylase-like acetyltransferase